MPCNNKHQEADRERMLMTRCTTCIKQYNDWGSWATSDQQKEMLMKSRYSRALNQVTDWGAWAITDTRKEQLLKSQCEGAISQVTDWPIWANAKNHRVERRTFIFKSRSVTAVALLNNWEKERSILALLLVGGHVGNCTIKYKLDDSTDDPATLRVFQIMGLINYIAAYMDGDKNIIGESVLEKIATRTLVDLDGATSSDSGLSQRANKCPRFK